MPRPTPPRSARNKNAFTYDIERLSLAAWLIHYRRTLQNPQWDLRFRINSLTRSIINRYPPLDPSGPQTEAPYQIYLPPPEAGATTMTVGGVNTMAAWNHYDVDTPWYDVMEAWLVPPGNNAIPAHNLTPEQLAEAEDPNLNNPAFLQADPDQTPQFLQIEHNPNVEQDILDDPDTESPDVTPTGWQWFQPDAMIAHQGIVRDENWARNWAFAPAFAAIQVIQAGVPNAQPFWVPIEDLVVYEYNPATQQLNGLPLFNGTPEYLQTADMQAANLPPGWVPLFTNENPFNATAMQTFYEFELQATDHDEDYHAQTTESPLTHLADEWAEQHPGSRPSANPFILDPALDYLQNIETWFTRFLANPATSRLPINLLLRNTRIALLLPNFIRPLEMPALGGGVAPHPTAISIARRWGPASIDRAGTAYHLNLLLHRHCFQPPASEEEEEDEEDEDEDESWISSSFTEPPDDTGGSDDGGPPPSGGGSSTGGQQGGSATGGGEEPGSGASGQRDREQDREEDPRDQKRQCQYDSDDSDLRCSAETLRGFGRRYFPYATGAMRSGDVRRLSTCADYGIILPSTMNCGEVTTESICRNAVSLHDDSDPNNVLYNNCQWNDDDQTCSSLVTGNTTGKLVHDNDPDTFCDQGDDTISVRQSTDDYCGMLSEYCDDYYSTKNGINCCTINDDNPYCFVPREGNGICGERLKEDDINGSYQCVLDISPNPDSDCADFNYQTGCLVNRDRCTWNPDTKTCQDGEDPLHRSLREPSPPPPPNVINGCTDPSASNYNPDATEDDGSCQLPMCGPINLNSPKINKNLCGEINNQRSCENTYFTLKLPSKQQHTYKCVWDEQGVSPGTSGGACSAYIGETTTYNQDSPSYRGNPPTTEELSQLLHKCEFLTAVPSYHTCSDYITSLCNEHDNTVRCMEENICSGTNPITNGPLIGTNDNFNVSPEMAEACGGGLPGRFGSRPNPDPGFDEVPYPSLGDDRPGYQIRNFKGVLNGVCGRLDISQRPVWDRAPLTGNRSNNQAFYDTLRRGAPGYYCTYSDVTNQINSTDCDSNLSWTQDASTQEDICNAQYTSDYKICDWDPGFMLGGTCKAGADCSGEANSSTYDCPSYSNNTTCNLYSDHCVWNSPTTRSENDEEMAVSYGFNMPSGIRREATTINVPGYCTAK